MSSRALGMRQQGTWKNHMIGHLEVRTTLHLVSMTSFQIQVAYQNTSTLNLLGKENTQNILILLVA